MTRAEKAILAVIVATAVGAFWLSHLAVREFEACAPAIVTENAGDRSLVSVECQGARP